MHTTCKRHHLAPRSRFRHQANEGSSGRFSGMVSSAWQVRCSARQQNWLPRCARLSSGRSLGAWRRMLARWRPDFCHALLFSLAYMGIKLLHFANGLLSVFSGIMASQHEGPGKAQ